MNVPTWFATVAAALLVGGTAGCSAVVTSGRGSVAGSEGATSPTGRAVVSPAPATVTETVQPTDFASIYARQRSGVVRIEVLGCSDSGIGTGFLLSSHLVATVDHVVARSVVVSLVDGQTRTTGQVIGYDSTTDLALVRSDQPIPGYHFHFATTPPRVGDRVAAIGFPIGGPITLTQGGVSGLNRSVNVEGEPRHGLIETDAAVNPGNSGGPLLDSTGAVVGLVDAKQLHASGIAYAVPATQAAPAVQNWTAAPREAHAASCRQPLGPSGQVNTPTTIPGLSSAASAGIATALTTYFDGINTGHYADAWQVLSPRLRSGSSLRSFAEGDSTSFDSGQSVLDARQITPTRADVALAFTSLQTAAKGPDGDTCDNWTLTYHMTEIGGDWYIDSTEPYAGTDHIAC